MSDVGQGSEDQADRVDSQEGSPSEEEFDHVITKDEVPEDAVSEVASFLGKPVTSPVGIPKGYEPTDSSAHDLFRVELLDFAGPLDLLLYLIRKHEIDIFDIPIKFITDEYLRMLKEMQALPIDIAGDFLVTAAELTHIKSKMLLPAKEGVAVEEEDDDDRDPREELVRRLLEYQKYRDAARQLGDRDRLGRDVFARVPPRLEADDELDPGLKNINIFRLVELMAKMMRSAPVHHEISIEPFDIGERIEYVVAFGAARDRKFTLLQLLQGIVSRAELVVTFIAVLEMVKGGLIRIRLDDDDAPPTEVQDGPMSGGPGGTEVMSGGPVSDDLPTIWIELTGEEGQIDNLVDDYR